MEKLNHLKENSLDPIKMEAYKSLWTKAEHNQPISDIED